MRFQQLKRDPNSVMRKKLVKSKKNWIVVSSLSLAGGLFLLGAPTTETVKADETTAPVSETATPTSTSNTNTATGSGTSATGSTSTEKQTTPAVTASTPATETSKASTDTTLATKEESSEVTPAKNVSGTPENADATTKSVTDSDTKAAETDTPVVNTDQATTDTKAVTTDAPVVNTDQTKTDTEVATDDTEKADTPATDESTGEKTTAEQTSATGTQSTADKSAVKTTDSAKAVSDVKADDSAEVKDGADATKKAVSDSTLKDGDLSDTDVVDPKVADTIQPVSLLATNILDSENQLAKMGIMAESLAIDPEAVVLNANGNIAEGTQGTTPWKIDADGVLHLGTAGVSSTLADNKTTTTQHVNTGAPINSTDTTTTTTTTESPTSPWMNNANDIKTISFDGTVTTASDMSYMFANLTNLTNVVNAKNLILTNSDGTPKITKTTGLFANDVRLVDWSNNSTPNTTPQIDLSSWNMSNVTDTSNMFLNNSSATQITLPTSQTTAPKKVANFDYMFKNDAKLTSLIGYDGTTTPSNGLKNWQFSYATSMLGMFQNDISLSTLDVSSWNMTKKPDTGNSEKGTGMFDGTNLSSIKLGMYNAFKSYTALPSTSAAGWTNKTNTFSAIPTDTKYNYTLSTIPSTLDIWGSTFSTDGTTPKTYSYTMIVKTNMGDQSVQVSGTLYSIVSAVPDTKTGYTPDVTTVYGNITSTGAVTSSYVIYTADASTPTVSTSKGNQPINVPAGAVGTTSTIDAPTIDGYDTPQVKVEYTKDGNIITDLDGNPITDTNPIKYVGVTNNATTAPVKNLDGSISTIVIPEGHFGDPDVTIKSTTVNGNVIPAVTVTYGDKGTPVVKQGNTVIDADHPISTTGVENPATTAPVKTADGKDSTIVIPEGHFGDKDVTIPSTTVNGSIIPEITVSYGEGGTPIVKQGDTVIDSTHPISTTGVENPATTAPVKTADGKDSTIVIPEGHFGDKDVTIPSTTVNGSVIPEITVSYGESGTPIVKQGDTVIDSTHPISTTGVENPATTAPVKTADGKDSTIVIPEGHFGDKDVTIPSTTVNGSIIPEITVSYGEGGTPIVKQGDTVIDANHPISTTGVENPATTAPVKTADGKDSTIVIPEGHFGDKDVTIPSTTVNGSVIPEITVSYGEGGTPIVKQGDTVIDANHPISTTGVENPATTAPVKTADGKDSTIVIPEGHFGNKDVTIPSTTVNGSVIPEITVSFGEGGTPIVKQGDTVIDSTHPISTTGVENPATTAPVKTADGKDSTIAIPEGHFGDKDVTIPSTTVNGSVIPEITVSYGEGGTPIVKQGDTVIDANHPISTTGFENPATTAPVKTADGKDSTIVIPEGHFGDKDVTIPSTTVNGSIIPEITVSYGEGGTPIVKQGDTVIDSTHPISTTGIDNKPTSIDVKNPDGTTSTITTPEGHFGDKDVTIPETNNNGYVTPELTVSFGKDGKPVVKQDGKVIDFSKPISTTGIESPATTVPVKNADGTSSTVDIPAGHYGDKDVVIPETTKDGSVIPEITVSFGKDGNPVVKQGNTVVNADIPITTTGVKNDATTVPVKNADGTSSTVDIPAGHYGDKNVVIPETTKDGSVIPEITVSFGKDGNPVVKQGNNVVDATHPISTTGVKNPGTTMTVKNPDGTTSNITIPEGHYGDKPVTVTADDKPGYKAPSVVVTYNASGIPTIADANDPTTPIDAATDVLTYKRISSGSSNHIVVPEGVGTIEKKQQTVATFSDKPDVEVYALDNNNKMSVVNDRILPHQTNWMSDESITIDGVTYYRVATNEWAKADQVYAYDAGNFFIRTYDDSVKLLYAAEGNIVQNRSLARSSSWISDRTAYIIDGQKYYRVATNEFVSAEDAYVYTPVNLNVRTTGGSYKNLYTAKGVQIQGRYINAHVALKVDSITYINGDKYCRVATNEFIKAEDVETY